MSPSDPRQGKQTPGPCPTRREYLSQPNRGLRYSTLAHCHGLEAEAPFFPHLALRNESATRYVASRLDLLFPEPRKYSPLCVQYSVVVVHRQGQTWPSGGGGWLDVVWRVERASQTTLARFAHLILGSLSMRHQSSRDKLGAGVPTESSPLTDSSVVRGRWRSTARGRQCWATAARHCEPGMHYARSAYDDPNTSIDGMQKGMSGNQESRT